MTLTLHDVSEYIRSLNRTSMSGLIDTLTEYKWWELKEVELNTIKWYGPMDKDLAAKYATQPAHTAPPVVLFPDTDGRWKVADGNHRVYAAFLRRDTAVRAYCPTNPPKNPLSEGSPAAI